MGWTGGQYSLYRVALAVAVGCELLALLGGAGLLAALLVAGLAAGYRDRLAARLLASLLLFAELVGRAPETISAFAELALDAASGRTALLPALLLLLHARVPAAPFGAFEARERTDPRGGWQRPAVQTEIGWALLCVALTAVFVGQIVGQDGGLLAGMPAAQSVALEPLEARASVGLRGFALAAAVFALVGLAVRHTRRAAWSALALFGLAWLAAARWGAVAAVPSDPATGNPAADIADRLSQLVLLIFACEPAWWSGRRLAAARADGADPAARSAHADAALPARLFYDGDCGFCHRSVRFILSEELATPAALRLRFAPLGSDTFRACLARHPELDAASLPDSIVLELEDGVVFTRSAAALEIASRLGGIWRLLALAGRLVPKPLLDAGYDGIARIRKRLFAQPKDACPILPPDLRARFDP